MVTFQIALIVSMLRHSANCVKTHDEQVQILQPTETLILHEKKKTHNNWLVG
jgi:hypothetical protein